MTMWKGDYDLRLNLSHVVPIEVKTFLVQPGPIPDRKGVVRADTKRGLGSINKQNQREN